MSRLWDTNDYWARAGADQLLARNPAVAPGLLADRLELDAPIDGDLAYTRALIRELHKRVDAGIRFGPDDDTTADLHRELSLATASDEADADAPLGSPANPYWWQKL